MLTTNYLYFQADGTFGKINCQSKRHSQDLGGPDHF